jgi:hypothetical protein
MPDGSIERDLPNGDVEITHSGRRLVRSPSRAGNSLRAYLQSLPDDGCCTLYDDAGNVLSRTRGAR